MTAPTKSPDRRCLRVLFLATRDWYDPATTGGDNTMWEEARYLASAGHEVTYVASGRAGGGRVQMIDGINVVHLGGIHWLWLTSLLYYLKEARGRYDLVVAEGFGGSRIPRLAPLYVREPIVTEWHQIHRDLFAIQYPRLLNGPLNLLERIAAWVSRDTLVRAGTQEWREAFPTIGFKPNNVFLLPVSVRDEWLDQPYARSADSKTILWLGKLRRYKCPDQLIRAMPAVVTQAPGARLVFAIRRDDLGYEKELRNLVDELNLEGLVEFRLNVSEDEKRTLMESARVLVITSAVEGFGIVALEANACGTPVVASTGVPEGAVRDGYNGLRYPFGDTHALSGALLRLIQDDRFHSQLSANSRAHAERYRWSRVGAEFEQIATAAAAHSHPAVVSQS